MENRFNLVDEKWIPVIGCGLVSLREIFQNPELKSLGGTPINKISILKLLLAISQSAYTPQNDEEWAELGYDGLANKCLEYLEEKKELFWLYGGKPFLQMLELEGKETNIKGKPIKYYHSSRSYLPDLSSTNDTILFDVQIDRQLTDPQRATLLVSLMNYAPGGKRVENLGALSPYYKGKGASAKAGPSLGGYHGYLNSCLWSDSILKTVYINIWTKDMISNIGYWPDSTIVPPWESMPTSEDDQTAIRIKNSIMGSLCGLSRFILFTEKGMIYAEGLQYPSHKDGWREPFFSWNAENKFLWLDTEKKPWRDIVSLLSLPMGDSEYDKNCPQINQLWNRARQNIDIIGIWSGGLQVRGTAGDQSVKQKDDFIESVLLIESSTIGSLWFSLLKEEIALFSKLGKQLYGSMKAYQKEQCIQNDETLRKATYKYWEQAENLFYTIVKDVESPRKLKIHHQTLAKIVQNIFNKDCPNRTARQMTAWAKNQPKLGKYFFKKKEVEIA